ncbi:hypothetical protein G3T14_20940 [Methylobacterium sp. BTF04]|uniref:hypothetical protein n=1 Tax=Methylobacterium sp. BTF04 TaxID=2708300 RepID=UPI0013D39251|nr:hypothetical protein [Methylobacterium sp. BTF04]NEU14564.1 hypothetical protein [Methylobacterium sp. BTF04]
MLTISSSSTAVHTSPKQRILDTIASQVSAGKISSTDQTALTSAVDDIDSSLTSGASSGSSSTKRLAPSDLKSRIDDLIGNEVSNGTLTSDQATTLKSVFAQGGKGSGQGGGGGVGGPGGPPPGPPPSGQGSDDASSDDSTSSTDASGSASTTSTATSTSDLLASFIKQLQATQSQTSSYSASGSNGSSRLTSAILLNFEA